MNIQFPSSTQLLCVQPLLSWREAAKDLVILSLALSPHIMKSAICLASIKLWEQPHFSRASGNWRLPASCPINLQMPTLCCSKWGLSHHRNCSEQLLSPQRKTPVVAILGADFLQSGTHLPEKKKIGGVGDFSALMKTGLHTRWRKGKLSCTPQNYRAINAVLTQNHRSWGWKGPLSLEEIICPTLLLKQVHLEQVAQVGIEYLQRRLHSLSGQPVTLKVKIFFLTVRWNFQFQFLSIAPCPVTGNHWK